MLNSRCRIPGAEFQVLNPVPPSSRRRLGPHGPTGPMGPMGPMDPMDPMDPMGPMGPMEPMGPWGPGTGESPHLFTARTGEPVTAPMEIRTTLNKNQNHPPRPPNKNQTGVAFRPHLFLVKKDPSILQNHPRTSSLGYGGYLTLLDIDFCIHFWLPLKWIWTGERPPGGEKSEIGKFTFKGPPGHSYPPSDAP